MADDDMNALMKTIPGNPGMGSQPFPSNPPTFSPNKPSSPFGKRTPMGANGMDNPTSGHSGMYKALGDLADKLHPVKGGNGSC